MSEKSYRTVGHPMAGRSLPVTIVHACQRDGSGGSPTAVLDDAPLTEAERRALPARLGTSHAVFVTTGETDGGRTGATLRFFTSAGELPACGHGTVAALAVLAERAGTERFEAELRAGGRTFTGSWARDGERVEAVFDPGPVRLREPTEAEAGLVLAALGIAEDTLAAGVRVASTGRWRLLVPVRSRAVLAGLSPDFDRLRSACDRLGLLGCYVHSVPGGEGALAARMFAPAIGVPEDIANANSTACLAAHLASEGRTRITVDMGDSLESPATVVATMRPRPVGPPLVRVGGEASVVRVVSWSP
ncbi:PhzF family phenazine biosynthesis protein [Streptomyces sp. NPDC001978]|uniref:PhzF family phenazine biosynthesis protein n=1 Tax=Streptomyces sp. NPDC001978 TaxID=3364627 RepID=UPI0036C765CD